MAVVYIYRYLGIYIAQESCYEMLFCLIIQFWRVYCRFMRRSQHQSRILASGCVMTLAVDRTTCIASTATWPQPEQWHSAVSSRQLWSITKLYCCILDMRSIHVTMGCYNSGMYVATDLYSTVLDPHRCLRLVTYCNCYQHLYCTI